MEDPFFEQALNKRDSIFFRAPRGLHTEEEGKFGFFVNHFLILSGGLRQRD